MTMLLMMGKSRARAVEVLELAGMRLLTVPQLARDIEAQLFRRDGGASSRIKPCQYLVGKTLNFSCSVHEAFSRQPASGPDVGHTI